MSFTILDDEKFNNWNKERDNIIKFLQSLPKDKPISTILIDEYAKQGLICDSSVIREKFHSVILACQEAGVRYDINTKYTKENLVELLQKNNKKYFKKMTPCNIINKINKDNKISITYPLIKYFGSTEKALIKAHISYKDYHWPNERIIKQLQYLFKKYGPFNKAKLNYFQKQDLICKPYVIRNKFGTIEEAGNQAGIIFGKAVPKIRNIYIGRKGLNEDKILDIIEQKNKIRLERQFFVKGKHIDGYDTKNAIAYEVDERGHRHNYQQIKDKQREELLKEHLNCKFVRINEQEFLQQIENQSIDNYS